MAPGEQQEARTDTSKGQRCSTCDPRDLERRETMRILVHCWGVPLAWLFVIEVAEASVVLQSRNFLALKFFFLSLQSIEIREPHTPAFPYRIPVNQDPQQVLESHIEVWCVQQPGQLWLELSGGRRRSEKRGWHQGYNVSHSSKTRATRHWLISTTSPFPFKELFIAPFGPPCMCQEDLVGLHRQRASLVTQSKL